MNGAGIFLPCIYLQLFLKAGFTPCNVHSFASQNVQLYNSFSLIDDLLQLCLSTFIFPKKEQTMLTMLLTVASSVIVCDDSLTH